MKLLIVDDQEEVGAIVSRIAQQNGWECVSTTDSSDVPRLIDSQKADAVLLDFAITGPPDAPRNGLTVAEEIRKKGRTLPVLLFTGWPGSVDAKEAERLGVLSVLVKPLSIVELRQALQLARKKCADDSSS